MTQCKVQNHIWTESREWERKVHYRYFHDHHYVCDHELQKVTVYIFVYLSLFFSLLPSFLSAKCIPFPLYTSHHMYEDIKYKKRQRKVKWNKRKERSALAIKKKYVICFFSFILYGYRGNPLHNLLHFSFTSPFLLLIYNIHEFIYKRNT
jgi:hypothetical protein